jgi:hypothetical protein
MSSTLSEMSKMGKSLLLVRQKPAGYRASAILYWYALVLTAFTSAGHNG